MPLEDRRHNLYARLYIVDREKWADQRRFIKYPYAIRPLSRREVTFPESRALVLRSEYKRWPGCRHPLDLRIDSFQEGNFPPP